MMNKYGQHPGKQELFKSETSYTFRVISILVVDFKMRREVAEQQVARSWFSKLLVNRPEFVTHYTPDYWAEEIYSNYQLIHA